MILGIYSPGLRFVCLQYGDVDNEINLIQSKYNITIHQRKDIDIFNNLDDLSSLINACDQVVSIANVTINLAGALGVQCKTIINTGSRWRFGEENHHCYWFPSLHLYRSDQFRNWEQPIQQIKQDLQQEYLLND